MQLPFDQREGTIWLDGKYIEWNDANIHILSHGLQYGGLVFEGIRIYQGKPFKLKEHMARLKNSAELIGFELEHAEAELCAATEELIKLNKIENGYIRPAAWRGTETMLISGAGTKTHVVIAAWESFEWMRHERKQTGVRLMVSKWRKANPDASPYQAKVAGVYAIASMVKNEAEAAGYDDVIMLDSDGNITESSTSNFFAIIGDELYTPIADRFLNGITRQTILQIASELGVVTHEVKLTLDDLKRASACFLTGTAIEIMPIKSVEDIEFELNNDLLQKLQYSYQRLTAT